MVLWPTNSQCETADRALVRSHSGGITSDRSATEDMGCKSPLQRRLVVGSASGLLWPQPGQRGIPCRSCWDLISVYLMGAYLSLWHLRWRAALHAFPCNRAHADSPGTRLLTTASPGHLLPPKCRPRNSLWAFVVATVNALLIRRLGGKSLLWDVIVVSTLADSCQSHCSPGRCSCRVGINRQSQKYANLLGSYIIMPPPPAFVWRLSV